MISDLWKSYDCLQNEGYQHLTVNHSLNFVDPDTGAHTPGIENTWWEVKRSMPRTGTSKDLFDSYLQEWLWRQHYKSDPFGNIIEHIVDLYNVKHQTTLCTFRDCIQILCFWREKREADSICGRKAEITDKIKKEVQTNLLNEALYLLTKKYTDHVYTK